ncbi:MAG: tripartite tricarboxylate transporter substrate binding protein [Burkholderiaceae bacterium]|nr:tripartite tricarboxylate transporter substrate binding protein [Burkholderiaceae bacterium]
MISKWMFPRLAGLLGTLACAIAASAMPVVSAAADWPTRPVRIIVPAGGGGGTADPISRVLADELTKRLGQPFVVENRGGANGNIGATAAAKSAPDGQTVLFSWAGTLATNISLYSHLPFHPQKDFDPVILIGAVPNVLVVNNALGVDTLDKFIALAKKEPGKLNYGSTGNGSSMHLAGELFKKRTGTFMVHIPYNAAGKATADLLANYTQLMFHLVTGAAPYVKSGQMKALAVLADKRSSVLPNVPTMAELGLKGVESETWFAMLFPKGTPHEAAAKLNATMNDILKDPAVREKLIGMGMEPLGGTPERLAAHLDAEIHKWAEVVKFSGAKIQ